jgi:hypothetical protein
MRITPTTTTKETPNMEPNPQHKVTKKDQNLILKNTFSLLKDMD